MLMVESRSVSLSIVLHAMALLIAAFGLPALLPETRDPMPLVMTVELLPISEISNVKPSDKPIEKEQKAPAEKNTKPIPPTAKEKPAEPTPPQEKTFDPDEGALPDDKIKPKEKPKEEEKKKPDDFAALLSKLNAEAKAVPAKDAKDATNAEENKTKSDAPYDPGLPLSISQQDSIRSQFIPCWNMPAGVKDAHLLAARVKIELAPDGRVQTANLDPAQMSRYRSDVVFRAAADSAIRAVHKCSPLKDLPPDKYGSWKAFTLNFDPSDLL